MQDKPVVIKGFGDGFRIIIDPNISEEELVSEMQLALEPITNLIKGSHLYIHSGEDDTELAKHLSPFLKKRFAVNSVTPFKDQTKIKADHKTRFRTRESERGWKTTKSDVLLITGRVRSGQKIDTGKHLVVYGDVNPGAEVIAGGDIIILGCLSGTAIAGQKQDNNSVIFALDFKPTQIQINDIVGMGGNRKTKKEPEIAYLNDAKELVVDSYLDKNPFSKLPWPEVR